MWFLRSIAAMTLVCAARALAADAVSETDVSAAWRKQTVQGDALYTAGRLNEAAHTLEKAVHLAEQFPATDSRLPATIHALAFVSQQKGNYRQAERLYLRAIHLWENIGAPEHEALLMSIDGLIGTYLEARNYRAATRLLKTRLPEMERSAVTWKKRAELFNTQAALFAVHHDYGPAEDLLRRSLGLWEQHLSGEEYNWSVVIMNLSHVLASSHRYDEAVSLAERAVSVLEKGGPADRHLIVRDLDYAASLYLQIRRPADAERSYRQALAVAQEVFGQDDPRCGDIELKYAAALKALHRNSEARAMSQSAEAILHRGNQQAVDVLALAPSAKH